MPDWGSSKFDHVAEMVVKLLENEMFVVPSVQCREGWAGVNSLWEGEGERV